MLTAIYKLGGNHNVWGVKASIKHVQGDEVADYVEQGWVDHPEKLFETAEPEPEPEGAKSAKKGSKAASDADSNEG